jgi:hypothetical protein
LVEAFNTILNADVVQLIAESVVTSTKTGSLDMTPVLKQVAANVHQLEQHQKCTERTWPVEFVNETGEKIILQIPCMDVKDVPDDAWGEDIIID